MRIIGIILLGLLTINATAGQPISLATKPAATVKSGPTIGEKEFEEALKEWLKAPARESEAAKTQRQKAVIDGLVGQQVFFKGKLGREEAKKDKVEVDVVDDSPTRTVIVTKTRDAATGVKIGKDITIGGEVVGAVIEKAQNRAIGGKWVMTPPRIVITVK